MPTDEIFISYYEITLRILLAALFGSVIGMEREKTSNFAGLRTNMLVCIGSSLIMIVSQYGFQNILQHNSVTLDPSRIAAQVVSGIGFLGAGTILFVKDKIKGLTTAAGLWTVAGLGLATGAGLYFAATITTALAFVVLAFLKPIEGAFFKKPRLNEIKFQVKPGISLIKLDEILTELNIRSELKSMQIQTENEKSSVRLQFHNMSKANILKFSNEIKKIPEIEKIESTQNFSNNPNLKE